MRQNHSKGQCEDKARMEDSIRRQGNASSVRRSAWKVGGVLALCTAVIFGAISFFRGSIHTVVIGSPKSVYDSFDYYTGPVLPLTFLEKQQDITAKRDIVYDFKSDSPLRGAISEIKVKEDYTLINNSSNKKVLRSVYPFAGSLRNLHEEMPTVNIEGQKVQTLLYTGKVKERNAEYFHNWEEYNKLLSDGSYMEEAFSPYPDLNKNVTVYTFTDFQAPTDKYRAATQAISFNIDTDKTTIITYGFEGMERDNNGYFRYSYFVPDENRQNDTKVLIVIGEDLKKYSLKGYKDGGCKKGDEIDGVWAEVQRSEQNLSKLIGELSSEYLKKYILENVDEMTIQLFNETVAEQLQPEALKGIHEFSNLEDIFSDNLSINRVYYLEFKTEIGSGSSKHIGINFTKKPSYNHTSSKLEYAGLVGYDMVTKLGSNISYDEITAKLENTENIEIVNQDYGFDLKNGILSVKLDVNKEHYYLLVKQG